MSKQQEHFEKLAGDVLSKAQRETGPYRDVLLGVAEAYSALALHQGVFDGWARTYPVTPPAPAQPPAPPAAPSASQASRSESQASRSASQVSRSASQLSSNASVGRQANENGKPTRPSAAA